MSLPRMTPEQLRRSRVLIKKMCCNYDDGYCLVLDCPCPQMHSYSVLCKWFNRDVLPQNEDLHTSVMKLSNAKVCPMCGKLFTYRSKNKKYCDSCKKKVLRSQKAKYQYKRRHG